MAGVVIIGAGQAGLSIAHSLQKKGIKPLILEKNYCFIANWSVSEFPLKFRKKFFNTISRSKYSIISFQENFENINNLKFFNKVKNKLKKKFIFNLQTFEHYNNSPLNKNNHYILTLIRK